MSKQMLSDVIKCTKQQRRSRNNICFYYFCVRSLSSAACTVFRQRILEFYKTLWVVSRKRF